MIACICRNIKDGDYATAEALKERIMQDDAVCSKCQIYYNNTQEKVNNIEHTQTGCLGVASVRT